MCWTHIWGAGINALMSSWYELGKKRTSYSISDSFQKTYWIVPPQVVIDTWVASGPLELLRIEKSRETLLPSHTLV